LRKGLKESKGLTGMVECFECHKKVRSLVNNFCIDCFKKYESEEGINNEEV